METGKAFFAFLHVEFVQSEAETYVLPLACAFGEDANSVAQNSLPFVIARVAMNKANQAGVLYEAIADKNFCTTLLKMISRSSGADGKRGKLETLRTPELEKLLAENSAPEPNAVKAEQSNSSIIFGDKLMLKFFRRMESGVNPDLEISRFLTACNFAHTPLLAGALEYRVGKSELSTVGILTSFVPKARDAWEYTLDALGKFYERTATLPAERRHPQLPSANIVKLAAAEIPADAISVIDTYAESARLLGQRTAEMHLALASEPDDKNFAPEPFTPHAQRGLFQSIRNLMRQNFQLLAKQANSLPPEVKAQAQQVLALEPEIIKRLRAIYQRHIDCDRIRHHGDFHLGQVLYTGKDFLIIDFEGEPAVALSERRIKRSPLRDVAGMVRSFNYVANAALLKQVERGTIADGQWPLMISWAQFWSRWVGAIYFRAYVRTAGAARFMPSNETDLRVMMDAYLLRKAIYEIGYELNNRPDWLKIPLQGILELVAQGEIAP
jgi:maltose alpha-D-glucosyltransferase/alpha-amylase